MADKHPYMSGSAGIMQITAQLRKSFPAIVTADTLKKLSIAPNNEGYVLNTLKFIGVLDPENKKTAAATPIFNQHNDKDFQNQFANLIEKAYHELFELHGANAWGLPIDKLIAFFRNHDGTSGIVGKRQATTFQALARLSGKAVDESESTVKSTSAGSSKPAKKTTPAKKSAPTTKTNPAEPASAPPPSPVGGLSPSGMGLTVRIEINLPPGGDQATYDAIFKSIRANLLNGNDSTV